MPGWYLHLDIARTALNRLEGLAQTPGTRHVFDQLGPDPATLTHIAQHYPAFTALGAIGPDIFFLLPDFLPGKKGQMMWGAAQVIKETYDTLDPWISVVADEFGPIGDNAGDIVDSLTGGLSTTLATTVKDFITVIIERLVIAAASQYDVFGLFGSGVQKACDEQAYFWSDMLHYRKTYEFAAHLWDKASALPDPERFQAFALGWMTHLAADVTGHCFVNQKCGGPYRLHWQRHHLIENHMDAFVYSSEYDGGSHYQDMTRSAMHLWIAFDDTKPNLSHNNFMSFTPDDRAVYNRSYRTPGILDRHSKWDYDSTMPEDLAGFLSEALGEVYGPGATLASPPPDHCTNAWADHPTNISVQTEASILPVGWTACGAINPDGYPTVCDIQTTYWWVYKYLKLTTTDYYRFAPPEAPTVYTLWHLPPFPSIPGAGTAGAATLGSILGGLMGSGSGTGSGSGGGGCISLLDIFDFLADVLAWMAWCLEVVIWFITLIPALILSAVTWPLRELIYEFVLLPLYNVEMAFHWYLAMIGYVHPRKDEISRAFTTLGEGTADIWATVEAALDDPYGGLSIPGPITQATGLDAFNVDLDHANYPHDVLLGPPTFLTILATTLSPTCNLPDTPSEFLRPWDFPGTAQELPRSHAGPYRTGSTASALLGATPGSPSVRDALEGAGSEADTNAILDVALLSGQHLGDPVDYTAYVLGRLTRDPSVRPPPANFNLDADRGYGYLCWDWVREHDHTATICQDTGVSGVTPVWPYTFPRVYQSPVQAGFGWLSGEASASTGGTLGYPMGTPCTSGPTSGPGSYAPGTPVQIRYIDREQK